MHATVFAFGYSVAFVADLCIAAAKRKEALAQCLQVCAQILGPCNDCSLGKFFGFVTFRLHVSNFALLHLIIASLLSMAVSRYELKPLDEMLVLCSDGVTDNTFFNGTTATVVEKARDLVTVYGFEVAPEELCSIAVDHTCDDNVTAVLVRFCEVKPKQAPARRPMTLGGAFKKL